jgi:hypothetical protein
MVIAVYALLPGGVSGKRCVDQHQSTAVSPEHYRRTLNRLRNSQLSYPGIIPFGGQPRTGELGMGKFYLTYPR